jgi:hypothetical protein
VVIRKEISLQSDPVICPMAAFGDLYGSKPEPLLRYDYLFFQSLGSSLATLFNLSNLQPPVDSLKYIVTKNNKLLI